MKELINTNEVKTIPSYEVAEMMGKRHGEVLEYIEGKYNKDGSARIVGIIPTLENGGIRYQNYFMPSTYKSGKREYKCYLCTKLGCELLGNKQQGEKGILFTAKYVERFNQMEQILKEQDIPSYQIEDKIKRAEKWIVEEKCRQQLYLENQELKQEVEELEEYKMFKNMLNNCIETSMYLGQFGQFLKSNTNLKTGQKLIFKYCKENGLVKLEYKENYATALAVNNGWFKNVGEYIDTKYGTKLVNKIMITKKGCLYLGKKLFNEYLENTLS